MKKFLAALAVLLLTACAHPAPAPKGYAALVFGFVDGKLEIATMLGTAPDAATCGKATQTIVDELKATAPDGASVVGECVPVPDAPAPVHKTVSQPLPGSEHSIQI